MKHPITKRAKPTKLVNLLVEEQKPNGTYNYWEVKIKEELADQLYEDGVIFWNVTNEVFGCDLAKYKAEWEHDLDKPMTKSHGNKKKSRPGNQII